LARGDGGSSRTEDESESMDLGARFILVQRVSVLTDRYISHYVNYGAVLICRNKPDRRRPEADVPAFSYAGDILPLDAF